MDGSWEYHIFTEELKRLKKEYRRCHNLSIRGEVYKDIELLEQALINLKDDPNI